MTRLAERGPFRLIRDVPQIGFVVLAAILCGDLAVVGQRKSDDRAGTPDTLAGATSAPSAAPSAVGPIEHEVFGSPDTGPLAGQNTNGYVADRKAELALRVAGEPERRAVAVVSFRATQTPKEVAAELPGVDASALFVRVQVKGKITPAGLLRVSNGSKETVQLALSGLLPGLITDEENNLSQASTVSNLGIAVNAAQKQAFLQEAATEKVEFGVLKTSGPSVYGAVVTGSYAELGLVAKGRQVRLVNPADDGVSAKSVVPHALAPDDTTTVAALETLPGLGAP